MSSSPAPAIVLVSALLILIVAVIFDRYCLQELTQTSDGELLYFPRQTWALIICISTPLGGMAFLTLGRVRY